MGELWSLYVKTPLVHMLVALLRLLSAPMSDQTEIALPSMSCTCVMCYFCTCVMCYVVLVVHTLRSMLMPVFLHVHFQVPKLIRQHYLRTWFLVDFLSTVPFDKIVASAYNQNKIRTQLRSIRLIKSLRLFRLIKMVRVIKLGKITESIKGKGCHICHICHICA